MFREIPYLAGAMARRGAGAAALRFAAFAAAVACAAILVPELAAAQRQSGIQVDKYDPSMVLVSKDIAGERWSITFDYENARGVVFKDSGPPQFVSCEFVDENEEGTTYFFDCWGAGPCESGGSCGDAAWTPIGTNLPIPASFFEPPGGVEASVATLPAPPRSGARP
jgi:hypothetical protein